MVAKKKSNSGAFLSIGLAAILLIVVLFIWFGSIRSPDGLDTSGELTCSTLCQESGYSGAVPDSCISIVECDTPNYPLVEGSETLCSELEVCCCQLGL